MSDPNLQLGPFVEGMVMGAIDLRRLAHTAELIGWSVETVDGARLALVFISPSGIRWRIRAEASTS